MTNGEVVMGYLFLGTGGGIAGAAAALATSGSFALAFAVYVFTGVALTLLAAGLSVLCAPIRQALGVQVTPTGDRREILRARI
jgi:hypothetical protein